MHHRHDRLSGISRFEFAIVVVVISIVTLPLIAALLRYQGILERQMMEADVRDMRTFLNLKLLDLMLLNRQSEIPKLVGSNPIALLERMPRDYLGESEQISQHGRHGWRFDRQHHELIYLPVSFSFPYNNEEGRELRWQMQQVKNTEMAVRLQAVPNAIRKPALAR